MRLIREFVRRYPGQSVVLYHGDTVLGGGVIRRALAVSASARSPAAMPVPGRYLP